MDELRLRNHEQLPPKEPGTSILLSMRGIVALLLLLAVGGCSLFSLGGPTAPPVILTVTADSPTTGSIETGEPSMEIPEEIPEPAPEDSAPNTPTPGFADDFDDGLDPIWSVIYGDPFIANGQLTSNVGAGLAAGDSSWRDYQIDFDVNATQVGCTFLDSSNSVGVRVADFDNAYWFVFTDCTAAWSFFVGGVNQGGLSLFPDTMVNTSRAAKHITIKTEETEMSAYENGSRLSSMADSRFQTGGIFLQIEAGTLYDNFKVILLP